MSFPFEIQSEIIKRLPVKSVVRCRSVSKRWKSLINSAEFIKTYHHHSCCKTQHHLFIRYKNEKSPSRRDMCKYVSIADDDTFPNQLNSSPLAVPPPLRRCWISTVTSVNGLLCFYGCSRRDVRGKKVAILWNPSVRKTVCIDVFNPVPQTNGRTYIGFGVSPISSTDPKLVRIDAIGVPTVLNWEVQVFTLSTRVWKTVSSSNIPPHFTTLRLDIDCVFVEGVIYWRAYDTSLKLAPPGTRSQFIISFDLMTDEFGEVSPPGWLVGTDGSKIYKVYDSLGMFQYYTQEDKTRFCDVWIMKDKSFTKILSIKAPDSWVLYKVLELRQNGEVIIENTDHTYSSVLEVYEPSSGRSTALGSNGTFNSISVNSYMETLLLLDHSNSIIHRRKRQRIGRSNSSYLSNYSSLPFESSVY